VSIDLFTGIARALGQDRLVRVENLIGTPSSDQLFGDSVANRFDGGAETICSRGAEATTR
jgi:hypothetical protein